MKTKWQWALFLLLAALLVVAAVWAARMVGHARSLKARLDALQAMAENDPGQVDIQTVIALVHGLHADVTALQSDARPVLWLTPYLGWVPRYGGDIQAAPHLLAMGLALMDSADTLLDAFSPLLEDAPGDPIQRGLQALSDAEPDLRVARAQLKAAAEARARVDARRLSPRVRGWVDRLDRYLPLAETGVDLAQVAPTLLGADSPRTYLILAQNEDELRPTGGFISAAGLVRVDHGKIAELRFDDANLVDNLNKPYGKPPQPLFDYMLSELWLFRDSNWSPDFPTSARQAAQLYTYGQDVAVDGVIALDQRVVQEVVRALEPVQVPGSDQPVTGDSVIHFMREAWGPPPTGVSKEWVLSRKAFIGQLAMALRARLEGQSEPRQWLQLAQAVIGALQQRHILIYVDVPAAAEVLAEQGWDGALRPAVGDYLMVVDANLGFGKVNPLIEESLAYTVTLEPAGASAAELAVAYRHKGTRSGTCRHSCEYKSGISYEAMIDRCYWDYLRVYVPSGSRLVEASSHPIPGSYLLSGKGTSGEAEVLSDEAGKAVFATFFVVERGAELQARLVYDLPAGVVRVLESGEWQYTLLVQKQPGTNAVPIHIILTLPPGVDLIQAEPSPVTIAGRQVSYDLRLVADQTMKVIFR